MIRRPSDWIAICDCCGCEMSADYDTEEFDFFDLLEGQGWIDEGAQVFCCEECRKEFHGKGDGE